MSGTAMRDSEACMDRPDRWDGDVGQESSVVYYRWLLNKSAKWSDDHSTQTRIHSPRHSVVNHQAMVMFMSKTRCSSI